MKYDALPTVSLADLDTEAFSALMRDLSALEHECELRVKTAEREVVDSPESSPLDAARSALVNGQVHAMQVRYEHDGVLWVDTILKTASAFRLVRMEQGPDRI